MMLANNACRALQGALGWPFLDVDCLLAQRMRVLAYVLALPADVSSGAYSPTHQLSKVSSSSSSRLT